MARRPPETTRLRSPHISFAEHMRELAGGKHSVHRSRRKLNNFFLKQEGVSELVPFLGAYNFCVISDVFHVMTTLISYVFFRMH